MSRAAILAAGGDPFLALMSLRSFEKVYQDEVDHLYVCYNASIDQKVVEYVKGRFEKNPKVTFIYVDHAIGFGEPINRCLDVCTEDNILLLEDDGWIYKKGLVDEMFTKIEGGVDLIGSPRFSCGLEIVEASAKKYGLDYSGEGDRGPNWWPNFLFMRRDLLMKTDRIFTGKGWRAGEYIPEVDLTCTTEQAADTFVWICMQLRNMGIKTLDVPQCHASPYEQDDINNKKGMWIGEPFGWIHGGSLSSGWDSYLLGKSFDASHEIAKLEFESRVAFWKIVSDIEKFDGIAEFRDQYKIGVEKLVNSHELNRGRINNKIKIYQGLLKPLYD